MGALSEIDVLVQEECSYINRSNSRTPEKALMFAVLMDAIGEIKKHWNSVVIKHIKTFEDAREWISSEDNSILFSFENICDYLDLSHQDFRRGIETWLCDQVKLLGETKDF